MTLSPECFDGMHSACMCEDACDAQRVHVRGRLRLWLPSKRNTFHPPGGRNLDGLTERAEATNNGVQNEPPES